MLSTYYRMNKTRFHVILFYASQQKSFYFLRRVNWCMSKQKKSFWKHFPLFEFKIETFNEIVRKGNSDVFK